MLHGVGATTRARRRPELGGTLWTRAMPCNGANYLTVDQVDDGGHDEHGLARPESQQPAQTASPITMIDVGRERLCQICQDFMFY